MSAKRKDTTQENPLVPHAVLQRMYEVMVDLRGLEPRGSLRTAGARGVRGEEACRASSLLSLAAGDLVSDAAGVVATGAALTSKRRSKGAAAGEAPTWLTPVEDAYERVTMALGAAAALRAQGGGRLVLVYVGAGELTTARWQKVLGRAGTMELPVIFLVLPGGAPARQGAVSDGAQGWGVPGMPVDATDGVALYRVMQESVMRARGGDGPALIESVRWQPRGERVKAIDGVAAMRRLLVSRGLLKRA